MLKKLTSVIIIVAILLCSLPAVVGAQETSALYVSPLGDDSAAGTIDAPLATMEGARARVLKLKNEGTYINEVIFRGGDYRVKKAIKFTAEDSGTEEKPIVYRAYEGETPKFKGSITLNPAKAYTLEDTRIHPNAKGKVVVFDLTQYGLTKADICDFSTGKVYFEDRLTDYGEYNTVFVDDNELDISTWPNGQNYAQWDYIPKDIPEDDQGRIFHYTSQEPDRWVDAKDWWIGASPQYDFQYITVSVERVDAENDTILVVSNPTLAQFVRDEKSPKSQKWKAFNLLEEIDMPGEFSIDRENMKLYLYPPYNLAGSTVEFSILGKSALDSTKSGTILSVTHTKNVVFEGIEFSQSRQNAVSVVEVENIDFINCSFKNIAGVAISNGNVLSYWQEGGNVKTGFDPYPDHSIAYQLTTNESAHLRNDSSYNVDIRGCVFSSIGKNAISMQGGNIDTLTKSGNIIEENYFTSANKRYASGSVVRINGCGNTFRNNVVTHARQNAIMLNGSLHTIEKNELYDVMRDTGDFGAIYQGGSILYRGTEIKENYIHDIYPANPLVVSGAAGIYQDEGQQGNFIHNNIISNAWIGYNSNWAGCIEFKDNTIINCTRPWSFYDASSTIANPKYTYAVNYSINKRREAKGIEPLTLAEYINTIPEESMAKYRETFPKLFEWAEAEEPFNAKAMSIHSGNLIVGKTLGRVSEQENKYASWSTTDGKVTDNVQVAATTEFVDARNHDYRLKSGMYLATKLPALNNDTNFDMDSVGLVSKTISFDKNTSPYRLLYPSNGATVSKSGLMLMWQEAFGANEYLVEIATDSNFEDIVFSETARYNHIDVDKAKLYSGNTYYWRVTAVNTSKSHCARWTSDHSSGNFLVK